MRYFEMATKRYVTPGTYAGHIVARRYLRRTATQIPASELKTLRKHVKKEGDTLFVNQYGDDWYSFTFGHKGIRSFKDFFEQVLSPYFEIINKDGLA